MKVELFEQTKNHLEKIGVNLYHLSWEREFGINILRIIVDEKEKIINMERIIVISKYLSQYFDENDPTTDDYNLEVLSAGLERELLRDEHWENSINKLVYIVFKKPINNVKRIYGHVTNFENGKIKIKVNDEKQKEYKIIINDIKSANWAFEERKNVR